MRNPDTASLITYRTSRTGFSRFMQYAALIFAMALVILAGSWSYWGIAWADGDKIPITIAFDDNSNFTEHGTYSVTPQEAAKGETVTITLTPDEGYVFLELQVRAEMQKSNDVVELFFSNVDFNGNTVTFTVPDDESITSIAITVITATIEQGLAGGTLESPIELTGNETAPLSGGYYVVNKDITFTQTVRLAGNVKLILSEGATMSVNITQSNTYGIDGCNDLGSLTVSGEGSLIVGSSLGRAISDIASYTQTGGTVTLSAKNFALYTTSGNSDSFVTISGGTITATGTTSSGISTNNLTISGGTVNATGLYYGLFAENALAISGGIVTAAATNKTQYDFDIQCNGESNNALTITGGQITANTKGIATAEGYPINIGFTDSDSFIIAAMYKKNRETDTLTVIDGCTLTDGTNEYSGEISDTSGLAGKTLRAKTYAVTLSGTGITADKTRAVPGETVTLSAPAGYTGVFKVNDVAIDGNTFIMPENDVEVTGTLTLTTYTISCELDGGTATGNPAQYTVESAAITLSNPTKRGHVFTGWTGTGIEDVALTVTIPAGSTGNRTYTATYRAKGFTPTDEGLPEFAYHAPVLSGQIGIKFYAYIPEEYRNSSTCWVDFDVSGDKSSNLNPVPFDASETITIDGDTFYTFECFINSIQMADVIHAELHYGDGETLSHSYRAKDYLDSAANDVALSEDLRELVKAMKDYGGYVQVPLADYNGWTIGKDHASMDCESECNDFAGTASGVAGHAISRDIPANSGIGKIEYSLVLDTETRIIVYLTTKAGYAGGVSANIDGTTDNYMAVKKGDRLYTIETNGIPSHELGKVHTITIGTDGGESFAVKVSAFSYVHDVLNDAGEAENLKRAVVALYNYCVKTIEYRRNRPSEFPQG